MARKSLRKFFTIKIQQTRTFSPGPQAQNTSIAKYVFSLSSTQANDSMHDDQLCSDNSVSFSHCDNLLIMHFWSINSESWGPGKLVLIKRSSDQIAGQNYPDRSEEHTSELQSRETISYAVFCLKKKNNNTKQQKDKNPQH